MENRQINPQNPLTITGAAFRKGLRLAIPVMLGYFPVGFAFGVLAVQGGLNPFTVGLMSYLCYAGSAQLIAAGMLTAGDGALSIVITTFVVNLRHLLMSAAVTPYLRTWTKPMQAWFSFEMTDETFALHLSRFYTTGVNPGEVFGINSISHLAWTASGVAGAVFGDVIGDVKPYGLDFALTGMFIALLLPHVRIPRRVLAIALGAALSVGLALAGAGQWNVMLATIGAATIAAFWPGMDKPRKDSPDHPAEQEEAKSSEAAGHGGSDTALEAGALTGPPPAVAEGDTP